MQHRIAHTPSAGPHRPFRVRALFAAAAAALVLAAGGAYAATIAMTPNVAKSKLGFIAHTKVFDVSGSFKKWSGDFRIDPENLEASSASLKINTASIFTDNDGRDDHLRSADFFESAKYPHMTFKSTKFVKTADDKVTVHGKLTIKNVQKAIKVPLKLVWAGEDGKKTLRARGVLSVNRFKHGLTWKAPFYKPSINKMVDIKLDVRVAQ